MCLFCLCVSVFFFQKLELTHYQKKSAKGLSVHRKILNGLLTRRNSYILAGLSTTGIVSLTVVVSTGGAIVVSILVVSLLPLPLPLLLQAIKIVARIAIAKNFFIC